MYVARNHYHSKAPAIANTLQKAIEDVRSDESSKDWVLCGFNGGENIKLIGCGTGGVEVRKQVVALPSAKRFRTRRALR